MSRIAINLLIAGLVTIPASGRPAPKPTQDDLVKAELSNLDGTWKTVSCQTDGVEVPGNTVEKMPLLTFKDGHFSIGGVDGKIVDIDSAASPKTVHYEADTDNEDYKTQLGIYKIDGDTFVDCVSLGGKERPKDFVSKKGSGHTLTKYKRVKE
jgi:uncharacterized protein (TIGR03067 family)